MHIGRSSKQYDIVDANNKKRIQAGSKGVGRFALSRLGREVIMITKKKSESGYVWKTDWNKSTLDEIAADFDKGTRIEIKGLREKWNLKKVQNLHDYLQRTYNDQAMKIVVKSDSYNEEVLPYFPKPDVGHNCRSNIKLNYNNGILETVIESDEFQKEVEAICKEIDIHSFIVKTDMLEELKGSELEEICDMDLNGKLSEIGAFSANFFFNLYTLKMDNEKFLYKYTQTSSTVLPGIILYRNAFSISSYEGNKDWLELGKRSRKSPAAASHPTGAWRVRENQLAGYVMIDKKENKVLQDMSNRQGLDENIYYRFFIEIILTGIKEFERYRQSIIRRVSSYYVTPRETKKSVSEQIIKKPSIVNNLNAKEAKQLSEELSSYKKEEKQAKEEKKEVEKRYKYDVRILNVLATTGLKASSIAHELENDRNDMNEIYDNIVDSLKEYDMWDELNSPDNKKQVYRNVPYMLEKNHNVSKKLVVFLDTMLSEIEKNQFEAKKRNIYELVADIKNTWERDYSWITIEVKIDSTIEHVISEDVMQVILDNLILNSAQQNDGFLDLNIVIEVTKNANMLVLTYKDNGKGLDKKYKENPFKILEVHETTRKNGHGLGMWIINNTVDMSGGEILDIKGDAGFEIKMTIGDKNND